MSWGTPTDHGLANSEGWELFDAEGSVCNREKNWPCQVQRLDEEAILDSDDAAHKVILAGALEGRKHHLKLLRHLRQHCKPELAFIYGAGNVDQCIHTNDKKIDELEQRIFGKVLTR